MIRTILEITAKILIDFIINNIYIKYKVFKKIIIDKNVNL